MLSRVSYTAACMAALVQMGSAALALGEQIDTSHYLDIDYDGNFLAWTGSYPSDGFIAVILGETEITIGGDLLVFSETVAGDCVFTSLTEYERDATIND